MKRLLLSLLRLLALAAISPLLAAADRWYEVEVLVLSHLNADTTAERWPENDSITLALDGAVPAPNTITTPMMATTPAPSAQELLRLAAVPPAQYKLQDAYKSLARARNYRPLLHTAWRQPIGPGKNNVKIRLAGGKDYAGRYGLLGKLLTSGDQPASEGLWEVDGYVQLSASRFLHVETEMLFRRPADVILPPPAADSPVPADVVTTTDTAATTEPATATNPATTPPTDAGPGWQTTDTLLVAEDHLQFYKLSQGRRLKANELHYFDHPLFGLLIVLRPLEPGSAGE